MMASSIFGAEPRISEPLSALAVLTGRHTENTHARPNFSQNKVNESTKSTSQRYRASGWSINSRTVVGLPYNWWHKNLSSFVHSAFINVVFVRFRTRKIRIKKQINISFDRIYIHNHIYSIHNKVSFEIKIDFITFIRALSSYLPW